MAKVAWRRGRFVLDFRDQTGKRRWVTMPKGITRQEAKIKLGKMLKQVEKETFRPSREIPKFEKVAEDWLTIKKVDLRYGSYKQYRGHIRNHLVPFLGRLRVDTVTYPAIERFKSHCRETDVSVATIKKILTTLGTIMVYAVRCRYIDHNTVREVEQPRKTSEDHSEIQPFSPEEIRAILDATPQRKYRMLFLFAALTGLRQGELFALKWGDVNWQDSQVHVKRTYNHGEFYQPKSKAGNRKVDLSPALLHELKEWRVASKYSKGTDLVFPTDVGTPLNHGNVLRRHYNPALEKAGVPHRKFHTFRHTFASLLLEQGENIRYISGQLGHSSTSLTLDVYSHLISSSNQEAATRLSDRVLGDS